MATSYATGTEIVDEPVYKEVWATEEVPHLGTKPRYAPGDLYSPGFYISETYIYYTTEYVKRNQQVGTKQVSKSVTLSGATINGGADNDVFVYSAGKDVITDYTAGQDKIKINSGSITKTAYSGKDVVFTIGSETLTVKNVNGKNITITDSANKTTTKTYTNATYTSSTSKMLESESLWFMGKR